MNGEVRVRPEAARAQMALRSLSCADSHSLDLLFSCSIAALDEPAERAVLAETFLNDRDSVGADDIAAHFAPKLFHALSATIQSKPVEHWTTETARSELIELLREAAKPVAFACGVDLLAPFELSVLSPTLERQRLEAAQRELVEQRVEGQARHVARAAELLRQFQSMRDAAPQLSPGKLLEQISAADRGSMLQTLLLASGAQQGGTLYAVAGPNLLRIDARQSPARCEVIPLPTTLGPLRSVQPSDDGPALLIGAQAGVMRVEPDRPTDAVCFADREIASSLGFNAVVRIGELLIATHGEAGIVAWATDQPDKPLWTIRSKGQGPRNPVRLDDSRVLCSAGSALLVVDRTGVPNAVESSGLSVIFIAMEAETVVVVRSDGTIDRLDRVSLSPISSIRSTGEVTAGATLRWLGTTRLLLATTDGPVACIGHDDPLVTHYQSVHRGLRAVAATGDLIAGISPDRQRIVYWKSWDARQPSGEVHVASVARHRAADVCFA